MSVRAVIGGKVVEVEPRPYKAQDGTTVQNVDVYFASPDPKYGPSRVSMLAAVAPLKDEIAHYICLITAKISRAGSAYENVYGVERVPALAGAKN